MYPQANVTNAYAFSLSADIIGWSWKGRGMRVIQLGLRFALGGYDRQIERPL